MKRFLLSSLMLLSAAYSLPGSEEATDLDRMQGVWQIVSLTEKGKALPAKETELLEVAIVKDLLTVSEKDKVLVRYRLKLDSSKTPKEIEFIARVVEAKEPKEKEKEKAKEMTELGIYAWDKDQLTLVIEEEGKKRPGGFSEKDTATCSVMVLKKKASANAEK